MNSYCRHSCTPSIRIKNAIRNSPTPCWNPLINVMNLLTLFFSLSLLGMIASIDLNISVHKRHIDKVSTFY